MRVHLSALPAGKTWGLTFVDDTDGSTRANTEPVYEFLHEHGILGAKTVWPLRASRSSCYRSGEDQSFDVASAADSTLQDPDYRDFVLRLRDRGFEIALHGASSGNSRREEVRAALALFCEVFGAPPAINVFHQTNVENLYCGAAKLDSPLLRLVERVLHGSRYEGHVEGSPYFWGDIARDTFKYVRLPFHTIAEANTLRVNPSMPFFDPMRPFVSAWFAASDGADVVRFNRLLSARNVKRLEEQQGVCIAYTHLANGFLRKSGELDCEFVATVERISGREGVWLATPSQILDRLASLRRLLVRHDGRIFSVTNESCASFADLAIVAPAGIRLRDRAGNEIPRSGDSLALPPLAPGETRDFEFDPPAAHLISPARSPEIARGERKRIERLNYAGLIRGKWADRRHASRARRLRG